MKRDKNIPGEKLEDAFQLFNQLSERLVGSYGDLEKQVVHLSGELAEARSEKLKQLAEKERLAVRMEGLLNTLPAGIVVLDGNGRINQANPVAEEMLGRNYPRGMVGNHWPDVAKSVFIHEGDELRLHDGRWISVSANSLGAEPGKIILINDVTETHNLQTALNQQRRLTSLGEMVASLAHQIRTPLATALLYLSNISHPRILESDKERFVKKTRERLCHLERMVNDMLLFARGDVAASECFSVNEFVQQLSHVLEPQLTRSHASLSIDNQVVNACIRGNRDALTAVFQNLVNNAIEACDAKPVIEISVVENCDETIVFSVKDNGSGIPDEIKERILEPFFTTRSQGTGLGLAVVNATIASHNGMLEVQSEVGVGSCILILLPVAERDGMLSSNLSDRNLAHYVGGRNKANNVINMFQV